MEKTIIGYIYKCTAPNGKNYIGQTIKLSKRKNDYKNGYFKKQIKLWNSCQAHNWNPIDTFEIIEECKTDPNKKILNEREIYWINFYNSQNNGLNCSTGGNGNPGRKASEETKRKISEAGKGRIFSQETCDKISNALKGKPKSAEHKIKCIVANLGNKHTDDTKKRISNAMKGKNNPNYGKEMNQEQKDKISITKKGKPWTEARRLAQKKYNSIVS